MIPLAVAAPSTKVEAKVETLKCLNYGALVMNVEPGDSWT